MIFNLLKNKVYDAFAAILVKINQVNPIDTGKIRDDLFVITHIQHEVITNECFM